ncbi:MAG: hypothetical protein VYC17_01365 [Nitrospinota bacterium]|nr:hypothetical protein [Nitrospinota bacterium]
MSRAGRRQAAIPVRCPSTKLIIYCQLYHGEMLKREKGFKRKMPRRPWIAWGYYRISIPFILGIAFTLDSGCGGVVSKERTLKKDRLTLTYRSMNRLSLDIDPVHLQHPARITQNVVITHLLSLRY